MGIHIHRSKKKTHMEVHHKPQVGKWSGPARMKAQYSRDLEISELEQSGSGRVRTWVSQHLKLSGQLGTGRIGSGNVRVRGGQGVEQLRSDESDLDELDLKQSGTWIGRILGLELARDWNSWELVELESATAGDRNSQGAE